MVVSVGPSPALRLSGSLGPVPAWSFGLHRLAVDPDSWSPSRFGDFPGFPLPVDEWL